MLGEKRSCQVCKQGFVIEPDDFAFYQKMKVPAPTFCPECRMQRRFAWRNERILFKRKCNAPGHSEDIISVFSPEAPVTVFDSKYWWSDAWDPLDYGVTYSFEKPFFEQFGNFIRQVPWITLSETNTSNCNYCNVVDGDKDCYLTSASGWNERVMYANCAVSTKDSSDLYISDNNELCYEIVSCIKSYKLLFSVNCIECINSAFLYECINCQNCFGCANLRNKQYYFFNEPYTKEDYETKIKSYNLNNYSGIVKARKDFKEIKDKAIRRYAKIIKSVNSTGDNIINAKNARDCFNILGSPSAEDVRYCSWAGYNIKEVWDGAPGIGEAEKCYEVFDMGQGSFEVCFSGVTYGSLDVKYSINCHGSRHLFGCYGLRNKQYCILNKQYTKEEYEALVPKIIAHMNEMPYVDKLGRVYKYGEFAPAELSPFGYNETIANDYFPLERSFAEKAGFLWRQSAGRNYSTTKNVDDLPDNINDVPDSIVNEVIECSHKGVCNHGCATAFRIVSDELSLYKKLGVAIPRLCFNCRHRERLAERNPFKLWHRKCMKPGCTNEFETSYAPDRPEIVYCESCYQQSLQTCRTINQLTEPNKSILFF